MIVRPLITLLFICFFISCKRTRKDNPTTLFKQIPKPTTTKDSVLSNDYSYYGDSILPEYKNLVAYLIKKYDVDTCAPMIYQKKNLKEIFEGLKNTGDINNDKKSDSVFVLNPLNWCEYDDGQAYYFTDTTLPRLKSGSYCSHPANFFRIQDIDEDGLCEVGFFYSSCVSRYKSIKVFRLKYNLWEEITVATFDILTQDPENVQLESLVKKISKNKFIVKSFIDDREYWDTVSIK